MISITTTEKVQLVIVPEDILGHTVPNSTITGTPLWNSSNVNISSLVVASDGFSAYAFGTGAGTASINIIANAGTVASPVEISGSITIAVTQAPATQLAISSSTVVSQ
jgi:hypothetical protein